MIKFDLAYNIFPVTLPDVSFGLLIAFRIPKIISVLFHLLLFMLFQFCWFLDLYANFPDGTMCLMLNLLLKTIIKRLFFIISFKTDLAYFIVQLDLCSLSSPEAFMGPLVC